MYQKRPAKQIQIDQKRPIKETYEKSPSYLSTAMYVKRDRYIYQKRPVKQTCIDQKRPIKERPATQCYILCNTLQHTLQYTFVVPELAISVKARDVATALPCCVYGRVSVLQCVAAACCSVPYFGFVYMDISDVL